MAERLTEEQRQRRKRFRDRNYRFRKLSKPRQRVWIARDVISQIRSRQLIPKHGVGYMVLGDYTRNSQFNALCMKEDPSDIREFIGDDVCHVCGIGGTFIAALKLADELTFKDINQTQDDQIMRDYLRSWFSDVQIALIECAFERNDAYLQKVGSRERRNKNHDAASRARNFGFEFDRPDQRLIAIMQNIIDNDGTFKP